MPVVMTRGANGEVIVNLNPSHTGIVNVEVIEGFSLEVANAEGAYVPISDLANVIFSPSGIKEYTAQYQLALERELVPAACDQLLKPEKARFAALLRSGDRTKHRDSSGVVTRADISGLLNISPDKIASAIQVKTFVESNAPIELVPTRESIKTGSTNPAGIKKLEARGYKLDGYNWGIPLLESQILEELGAATEAEKLALAKELKIIPPEMTIEEVVEYGIVISEHWYGMGAARLNTGVALPVKELPSDMKLSITAKRLTSAVPLSIQSHEFDEMIVAKKAGDYAYIGFIKDLTPLAMLKALLTGDIESLMNRVTFEEAGESYLVPAGTVHAYGKVDVMEMKGVSAEMEKATRETGRSTTSSFYDRLAMTVQDKQKIESKKETIAKAVKQIFAEREAGRIGKASELLASLQQDILESLSSETAAKIRSKKDVLTMPLENSKTFAGEYEVNIMDNIRSLEAAGGLKALKPESLKVRPMTVSKTDSGKSKLELLAVNTGFTWQRFTLAQGEKLAADYLATTSLNRLVVESGEAELRDIKTGAVKETLKAGSTYMMLPNQTERYELAAVKGPAVVYSDYNPTHKGELLVTAARQAMNRELARPEQKTFTMWVMKSMYNQNGYIEERAAIAQITGNRVTLRQYDDISKVNADPNTDVIIATDADIQRIKQDSAIAASTKSARILPVSKTYIDFLVDKGYITGYAREVEVIGMILGNTELKDITDKTERGMDLYNLLRGRTKNTITDISQIIALLGVDPQGPVGTIDNRLAKLLGLPIIIPFDANREIDGAIKGRRQALWSA